MAQITITADPLPTNFSGTPQEFLEALVERLNVTTDQVGFVISDVQPSSNVGPWLKNGKEIWVWDEDQSTYVPLDISASIKEQIWIGEAAPPNVSDVDPTPTHRLWFRLSGSTVLGLYYWMGGSGWVTRSELLDGSVTSSKIASGAVQTQHLGDGVVTSAKLASTLDLSNKTVQLPVNSVTAANIVQSLDLSGKTLVLPTVVLGPKPSASSIVFEHSLNRVPRIYTVVASPASGSIAGYEPGDEINIMSAFDGDNMNKFCSVFATATNIQVVTLADPTKYVVSKTGSKVAITSSWANGQWNVKVYILV